MFAEINLDPGTIALWLVVGFVAGWFAGLVMKAGGYGLFGDIIVGLVGAVIGGFLFGLLDIGVAGLWGSTVVAFLGACIFVAIVRYAVPVPTRSWGWRR